MGWNHYLQHPYRDIVDILHIQLVVTVLLSLLQLFSTLNAYIRSMKERKSQKQDRHKDYSRKPSRGRKTNKLLLNRFFNQEQHKDKKNRCSFCCITPLSKTCTPFSLLCLSEMSD
jgi:hypothetical protein